MYGAIFLGVLVACQREPGYKITGSVPGTPDGMKVYLYNWNTPVDSGVVKGGKFVLTGKVDVPVRYQLWVDLSPDKNMEYEKDMRGSDIFVDNTDIRYETPSIDSLASRMSFHRKEVKGKVLITGSPVHDLYLKYKEKIRPYSNRSSEAWNEYLDQPDSRVYDPLDKVRERAGVLPVREAWGSYSNNPVKVTTKVGMRDIIHQEYGIEFAFEGHRYWDIRRWLTAHQTMNEKQYGWNVIGTTDQAFYNYETGPVVVYSSNKFIAPRDYLDPFDAEEILISGMVQNPGWGGR